MLTFASFLSGVGLTAGGLARVDFSQESIHFNHNCSWCVGGLVIDWQVFAYTVCGKMSRPASPPTCAGRQQNKLMRVIYHVACALGWGVGGGGGVSSPHHC